MINTLLFSLRSKLSILLQEKIDPSTFILSRQFSHSSTVSVFNVSTYALVMTKQALYTSGHLRRREREREREKQRGRKRGRVRERMRIRADSVSDIRLVGLPNGWPVCGTETHTCPTLSWWLSQVNSLASSLSLSPSLSHTLISPARSGLAVRVCVRMF